MASKPTSSSPGSSPTRGLIARCVAALEQAGVAHMLIGGQAVLLHGHRRFTDDVDFTLVLTPADARKLIRIMRRAGLKPAVEDPEQFARYTLLIPFDDTATGVRVDAAFTDSAYTRQAIDRAVVRRVDGTAVRFAASEDLVILKVIAQREVDLHDIRSLLTRNPDMDHAYIRDWLRQFEEIVEKPLVDKFDGLLKESRAAGRRKK